MLRRDDARITATRTATAEELSILGMGGMYGPESPCVLQVLYSPSTPELLLLRAVLTAEPILVLCERTVCMDMIGEEGHGVETGWTGWTGSMRKKQEGPLCPRSRGTKAILSILFILSEPLIEWVPVGLGVRNFFLNSRRSAPQFINRPVLMPVAFR